MKFIFAIMLSVALGMASAQAPAGTYRVRPGESLAAIANALVLQETVAGAEKPSVAQRMVAIYRANPKAFSGSMNQLLDGSELRLPSAAEIAAVNPALARLELADQISEYLASKPRPADSSSNDTTQVAQASEEQVIAGLQKALRRKDRELAALRTELEAQREPLPAPNAGSLAVAPASGTDKAKVEAKAKAKAEAEVEGKGKIGGGASASAEPTLAGLAGRGVFSPGGLAVAGTVALLGGFGLLWTLRGRGQAVRRSAEFTDVTDVTDVRAASNSVVEAEVLQRMPDLSGFSGLGSATPRVRDPSA
jgi:FimV-like protein